MAYFALAVPQDADHRAAVTLVEQLSRLPVRLFTTNLVVAETHGLLIVRRNRTVAATFLRDIDQSTTAIVRVSAGDERRHARSSFSTTTRISR